MPLDLDTGKLLKDHRPYIDSFGSGYFVRTFKQSINTGDLTWHKDSQGRLLIPMRGENWKLQFDNELPIILEIGNVYEIMPEIYHRLIKGNGDLVLFVIPYS